MMMTVDSTRILTRSEIAMVLKDLHRKRMRRSFNRRMNLTVFRLATCCGLRASEIAGLTLGDVIVGAGISRPHLSLPADICKGKKPRRVPLWWDAGTLADIEEHLKWRLTCGAGATDPMIPTVKGARIGLPSNRFRIRKRFLTACRILGPQRLEHLTIHHGRHSFVSHAIAGGRSLAEVKEAAGHSNIATTSIYAHVARDDDQVGSLFSFDTGAKPPCPENARPVQASAVRTSTRTAIFHPTSARRPMSRPLLGRPN